jgi:hypothetical protein
MEGSKVGKNPARPEDFAAYYEAADRQRLVVGGDPLKRYTERRIARERMLLAASCLFMTVMMAAFVAMAIP